MIEVVPGQQWRLAGAEAAQSPGTGATRLVVGAVVSFRTREDIICCSVVSDSPNGGPSGMPFLPLARSAFLGSVSGCDGEADPAPEFADDFADWQSDARGMMVFTIPFEGRLDVLVKKQMASTARRHTENRVAA